jgi:flagellar FliL protein
MAVKKDGESAPEPKRRSRLKLVLAVIVLLLLLGGGGASFWWLQMREPGEPVAAAGASSAAQNEEGTARDRAQAGTQPPAADLPRPAVSIVPLPRILVNLADVAEDRYLTIGMEVEVSSPDAARELQAQTARVRDAVIILLSGKTYADLSTAEGKLQLKNEVASRLNQILGVPRVVRIYFTDFIVQ